MAQDMMDRLLIKGLDMVSESFQRPMEMFIWGIGSKTDFMAMDFMFIKMARDMKGNCSRG